MLTTIQFFSIEYHRICYKTKENVLSLSFFLIVHLILMANNLKCVKCIKCFNLNVDKIGDLIYSI